MYQATNSCNLENSAYNYFIFNNLDINNFTNTVFPTSLSYSLLKEPKT